MQILSRTQETVPSIQDVSSVSELESIRDDYLNVEKKLNKSNNNMYLSLAGFSLIGILNTLSASYVTYAYITETGDIPIGMVGVALLVNASIFLLGKVTYGGIQQNHASEAIISERISEVNSKIRQQQFFNGVL